jgi:WD40 repeat protein
MRLTLSQISWVLLLPLLVALGLGAKPASLEDHPAKAQTIPPGAIARLGNARFWHEGRVGAIAVSSDGKLLATAESIFSAQRQEALIRLWDTQTGRSLSSAPMDGPSAESLAFSADNRSLVLAGMSILRLYDIGSDGQAHRRWQIISGGGRVSFAADGKSVLTYNPFENALLQLDRATGTSVRKWKPPEANQREGPGKSGKFDKPRDGLLSPDGRWLAWAIQEYTPVPNKPRAMTLSDERVEVFDAGSGKRLYVKHFRGSVAPSFSPNSRFLAIEGDAIAVLESASGKLIHQFPGKGGLSQLLFTPDSRVLVAVGSRAGRIDGWSMATGKKAVSFYAGRVEHECCAALSGSSGFWLGQDHLVRSWDIPQGKEITPSTGHGRPVTYLSFSADGRKLFSASDAALIDWDVSERKEIRRSILGNGVSEGQLECVSVPLRRSLWNVHSGAGEDDQASIYELRDADSGALIHRISGKPLGVFGGKYFAFVGNTLLDWSSTNESSRYDGETGKEIGKARYAGLDFPTDISQAVSPDGKILAACSSKGTVMLLASDTGRVLRHFKDPLVVSKGKPLALLYRFIFSPDGKYLASDPTGAVVAEGPFTEPDPTGAVVADPPTSESDLNIIQVFDVEDGREVARVGSPPALDQRLPPTGLAFSRDHRLVAFGRGNSIHVWEIASQTERARFDVEGATVTSVAFSSDRNVLGAGKEDGTIELRNLRPSEAERVRFSGEALPAYWRTLSEPDSKKAEQAARVLVDGGQKSVALIHRLCKPVQSPSDSELASLIRDVDSDQYAVREQATTDLRELGELARSAIEKALQGKVGLEARHRLEKLLRESRSLASSHRELQAWRAIEVLERIGSSDAKEVLRTLASGVPDARVTREAQTCLERLNRRTKN